MARVAKCLSLPCPKRASPSKLLIIGALAPMLIAPGGGIAAAKPTTTPTPGTQHDY